MNVRSLRFKLGWTNALLITVVFLAIGFIRYEVLSYRAHLSFDSDLLEDARDFATRLHFPESGAVTISTEGLPPSEVLALERIRPYFAVTDLKGTVLRPELHSAYIQDMLDAGALSEVLRSHSGFSRAEGVDGRQIRFYSLPFAAGASAEQVILHVGQSTEPIEAVIRESLLIYLYSVPLIIFVSGAIGWLLAGRALKPFEDVAQVAGLITSKNLNMKVVTPHKEIEVQRLVDAFNSMVGRLNRSFEQLRQFNADAAHELRTPLAILQGETEIALNSMDLPEDTRSLLASNLEELDRLTRVVNEILTLSEAEAGTRNISKVPLDLKPLLEDLVEHLNLLALDMDVRIHLPQLSAAVIEGDELWIRRAIINLLDNAIRYSKPGSNIWVAATVDGERVRLSIRDQGIGISAADIPFIFDRLYRADPARSRNSGGSGLGLSLVKWVVEAHEGTVHVSSRPDEGSEFTVEIPLARAHSSISGLLQG